MKVAIDSSPLKTGHQFRGTGAYIRELLTALRQYHPEHEYLEMKSGDKLPGGVDLVHYPYFEPFRPSLPLSVGKPTIVTVHDLIPIAYQSHFPRGLRGEIIWRLQCFSLGRVARIITDSEASQKDIERIIGFDTSRIDVVYLAPAKAFRIIKEKEILTQVKKTYHLPSQFLVYVGDVNWNKNIHGMLEAFSQVTKDPKYSQLELLLIGKGFTNEAIPEMKDLRQDLKDFGLETQVRILGFVSEEDLVVLYNLAISSILVSYAEGFGLPALEAMACGTPVIISGISSLGEIAGPALRVDPYDNHAIAEAIKKMVDSTKINSEAYVRWAKEFSWKNVADQTIESYKKALMK